jgi:2-(1,2-epoxy-1,2-dihydrophenyl)acetyl-CoA isomerase
MQRFHIMKEVLPRVTPQARRMRSSAGSAWSGEEAERIIISKLIREVRFMPEDILCTINNSIATVTLNRPATLNAFSEEMMVEGKRLFDSLSQDAAVRCVVLTGSGKNFSAGGDITDFKRLLEDKIYLTREFIEQCGAMARSILTCAKPVIAMINGAAAGGGCSLALACDFRVVTGKSRLLMAFVNVGLAGDTGGIYNLQKIVGMGKAREMLMLGEPVLGREAVAVGLATQLAEEGKLEETTYALAAKLAAMPPKAIKEQKEILFEQFYRHYSDYTRQEVNSIVQGSKSADFAEATHAFLEKRKPVFSGK